MFPAINELNTLALWQPVMTANGVKYMHRSFNIFVLSVCSCLIVILAHAQAGQNSWTFVCGGTNAGIHVSVFDTINYGHELSVEIYFDPPSTNIEVDYNVIMRIAETPATNLVVRDITKDWIYFRATNLFCGPIELVDAAGQKIPLTTPDVNDPKSYPERYKLSDTQRSFMRRNHHGAFVGPILNHRTWLCTFTVRDHFNIISAGEYRLTIWPKIYRRSAANTDVCERIDLPPVIVPIKWQ